MAIKHRKKKQPKAKEKRDTFMRLRATVAEKAKIEQAAAAVDMDNSEFMRKVLLSASSEVLEREHQTMLLEEAWNAFMRDLDSPAKPIPALAAILKRKPLWEQA